MLLRLPRPRSHLFPPLASDSVNSSHGLQCESRTEERRHSLKYSIIKPPLIHETTCDVPPAKITQIQNRIIIISAYENWYFDPYWANPTKRQQQHITSHHITLHIKGCKNFNIRALNIVNSNICFSLLHGECEDCFAFIQTSWLIILWLHETCCCPLLNTSFHSYILLILPSFEWVSSF